MPLKKLFQCLDSQGEPDNGSITVLTRHACVLTLLDEHRTDTVEGQHRLQKLVFLTDHALSDLDLYPYRKYDYGPYSMTLERDIQELADLDVLRVSTEHTVGGRTRYSYTIRPNGQDALEYLVNEHVVAERIHNAACDISAEYADYAIFPLIEAVRDDHPEYWENSVYITRT